MMQVFQAIAMAASQAISLPMPSQSRSDWQHSVERLDKANAKRDRRRQRNLANVKK